MSKHLYLFLNDCKPWIMIPIMVLLYWFLWMPASAVAFRLTVEYITWVGVMQAAFAAGLWGLISVWLLIMLIAHLYDAFLTWLYPRYLKHFTDK